MTTTTQTSKPLTLAYVQRMLRERTELQWEICSFLHAQELGIEPAATVDRINRFKAVLDQAEKEMP